MSNRRRQIMGSSFPYPVTPVTVVGPTESTEFQQFLDRVSAPDTTHKNLYRALINGLVTDGVWSLIDGLYVMAAADSTTALVNLKQSSFGLTASGTMNFTANFGYYSDGSTGYLDTGYTPSTSGGNFSTAGGDGGSLAVYIQSIETSATMRNEIYCNGTTSQDYIQSRGSNGSCNAAIGSSGNNRTLPSTQGSLLLSRTSHTTDFLYRNEAQFGTLGNQAAFSIPDATIRLFYGVGSASFSTRVNSAAMFGGTLTQAQAGAYQSRINDYMIGLGINVYETAEFTQFLGRISTPDTLHKNAYRALINGLVTDGVWPSLDGLYMLAAADSTTALTNLKQSSYGCTALGTVSFTANRGYLNTVNGAHLDTGYSPLSSGGNFPANGSTGMLSAYIISTGTSSSTSPDLYCPLDPNGSSALIIRSDIVYGGVKVFAVTGDSNSGAVQGMYSVSRTGSTTTTRYKNGSAMASSDSTAINGNPYFTDNITITGNSTSFGTTTSRETAAAVFGAGLDSTLVAALHSRINAYMTALGINVY